MTFFKLTRPKQLVVLFLLVVFVFLLVSCGGLSITEEGLVSGKRMKGSVVVPAEIKGKTVKGIANRGFCAEYNNSAITSIELPESIRTIGYNAFEGCTNLERIVIPEGVEIIERCAFRGCTSLVEVVLPQTLKKIDSSAFGNCTSLKEIEIPNGVQELDGFDGCSSLVKVVIPEGVKKIENNAFEDCTSLVEISLPKSVSEIGDYAFEDCKNLISITISNVYCEIGNKVFDYCSKLKYIYYSGTKYRWDYRDKNGNLFGSSGVNPSGDVIVVAEDGDIRYSTKSKQSYDYTIPLQSCEHDWRPYYGNGAGTNLWKCWKCGAVANFN